MVGRNGKLTGDYSPLHSSEDFARRSTYCNKIVNGMLALGFVSLLEFFHIDGFICWPVELSGQFIEAVHIGDQLSLRGEIVDLVYNES